MPNIGVVALVAVKYSTRHILRRVASAPFFTTAVSIALSALLFLGAIAVVFAQSDWTAVAASLVRLSWLSIATAFSLMLVGGVLASLRLKLIADDLGYRLSFRDAVSALSLGHLAGILFFQIAGQLMARGVLFSRRRIPVSGTIVVTGYERLMALAVSFTLAVIGAIYLFGKLSINTAQGGVLIIKIFLGLLIVVICGAIFCWGRLAVNNLPQIASGAFVRLGRSLALSLAIQFATMGAYVVLLRAVNPNISAISLSAGSALVMFAASLPISFSGWGIRELSAIIALGAIGVSAEASFAVAAIIGLISFSVVGLLAVSAIHHHHRPTPIQNREQTIKFDFGALLDYALPLFAATAVFFQVFVPVNRGAINVNLADPAVILGGCLFVLYCANKGWPQWRIPHFETYVGLATLLIVTAFLHGLDRFGWTNWAFTNRMLGWFVLLAYGATGALIVHRAERRGLDLLLRTFVVAAASIVALELIFLLFYSAGAQFLRDFVDLPFVGFSANRNAFALQLLFAVCAVLAARWEKSILVLGIVFTGLWFSGSRAALVALSIVMGMAAYMGCLAWRPTLKALALAIAITIFVVFIPNLIAIFTPHLIGHVSPANSFTDNYFAIVMSPSTSNVERIKSLLGGWAMFQSHPIFGAGLGAYMNQEMQAGTPLVIHSTLLWLLAETGLIGSLIMLTPIVRIFWSEVRHSQDSDIGGLVLVLIITTFAVVSNAHEIMYQRAFWLLLGAALAYVPAALSEKNAAIAS